MAVEEISMIFLESLGDIMNKYNLVAHGTSGKGHASVAWDTSEWIDSC